MTNLKQRNIIFAHGIVSVAFLAVSFLMRGSLDLSFHDTYYILPNSTVIMVVAVLFAVFTITILRIYLMGRHMSAMLNWIHFGLTFACIATMMFFIFKTDNFKLSEAINEWLAVILIVLIISQLLFVVNVIRAFVLKKE